MRRVILSLILALSAALAQNPFLQKPYLQLGDRPRNLDREGVTVLWHAPDQDGNWSAEVRSEGESSWRQSGAPQVRRIDVRGVQPHRVYSAELTGLAPGRKFTYRILMDGKPVFEASATARRPAGQPHTLAVMGDIAQDSDGQRAIAWQLAQAKPEYLVQVGDIVYARGLVSEYYKKYFPAMNADEPQASKGGPILRSMVSLGIPGNHDMSAKMDLGAQPEALAYFYYLSMPLNGPLSRSAEGNYPELKGGDDVMKAFYAAAPGFPQMAMYSFDYGDAHWTMLDSNSYVDWTEPKLREWVRNDLRSAKGAKWRFVGLHHPPFQSSRNHFGDQWMRVLADIFQEEGVDIVFSGHVHNYQRTHPLKFTIKPEDAQSPMKRGKIDGTWTLDKNYDGAAKTRPDGIIWIVTGAGGAGLYNKEQEGDRQSWQEFTLRFVSTIHSFTLVDVSPDRVTVRQVDANGKEIDRFALTR
jgi:hypothetical protein